MFCRPHMGKCIEAQIVCIVERNVAEVVVVAQAVVVLRLAQRHAELWRGEEHEDKVPGGGQAKTSLTLQLRKAPW